ncbi:MAG: hypothetical protein M3N13_02640 [Candidatus Eremiobacteraeota bacterium]|nr:hypothetical protein [Candidatus Eremiobacteraeota bacterium]
MRSRAAPDRIGADPFVGRAELRIDHRLDRVAIELRRAQQIDDHRFVQEAVAAAVVAQVDHAAVHRARRCERDYFVEERARRLLRRVDDFVVADVQKLRGSVAAPLIVRGSAAAAPVDR